jgi:5-methyltetrahydropteroyltriglutamate--homocysteine methyltransferase
LGNLVPASLSHASRAPLAEENWAWGVVNPRTSPVAPPEAMVARGQEVLKYPPPECLFLNPDCGVGTFARRPTNTPKTAARRMGAASAASLRA